MEHRERQTRLEAYEREVVGLLLRLLIEEKRETLMGESGFRIRTEEVRLERHESGYDVAVVLFRLAGREGLFGSRMRIAYGPEQADPTSPSFEPPDLCAEVVLVNLEEAILTRRPTGPDPDGVSWFAF